MFCIPISEPNIVHKSEIKKDETTISSLKKGTDGDIINLEQEYYEKYSSPNFKNPGKHSENAKTGYQTHILTREEVEDMKKEIGVRDMNKNYNLIINGHGTGLAPPTEEEWEWMIGRIEVVDGLNGHSTPLIPKEFDNSGVNDDKEVPGPVKDAVPTREGTGTTSSTRGTDRSEGPTSRGIGVGLPTSVDHSTSNYFPAVGDQGHQGSCAAWATTYYAQGFMQAKDNGWNQAHQGNAGQLMSPAWTYNKVNHGVDGGSHPWTNGIILQQFGCPTWTNMPYNDTDLVSWGSETAWRKAPTYRISDFQITTPDNIDVIKSWLKDGYVCPMALDADNYEHLGDNDDTITSSEYVHVSSSHANTIVGFDDSKIVDGEIGAFKLVNSWSPAFGSDSGWYGDWNGHGFYWMTYRAFCELDYPVTRLLDNPDYKPELLATWKFSTPGARDTNITIGIGNPNAPLEKTDLQYDGGNHSFPAFMCMDISNLTGHLGLADFFLDIDAGSNNSRISSFRLEQYGNQYVINGSIRKSNESSDVPFNTPGTAYNDIFDLHVNITSPLKHEYVGNGNVIMKGNSSISVTETILEESFEGSFPGDWIVGDSNASSGQDYWSNSSVKASNGSWSGYCAGYKEPVYYEDFNHGGNLPPGWITQSNGPDNYPWFSHNDDVPYLYGTDDYGMVVSSYAAGPGKDITEWFAMSQSFDTSEYSFLQLDFQIAFLDYDGDEFIEVLYANGSSYPNFNSLGYWTTSTYGRKSINLSSAAGESDVYLAFKYHGTYDNYVIIDDVIVTSDISGKYEVGMDSYMYMNVSLSNYDYVNLTYDFWLDCENQIDALYLMYFSGGNWHYVNGLTGNWQNSWWHTWYNLPTTTTKVGFYFYSDVSIVLEGAYIDNILLTGYVNRTKVDVKVDNGGWHSDIGTADNWAVTIDTSQFPDGNHTISVRSYYGPQRYSYTSTYLNFDNTPPQFNSWSNSTAQMGQNLYLETSVDDNIKMGNVYLNYSINDGRYNNISLQKGGGNIWMKNIVLPVNAVKMNLFFWANDSLGNADISSNYTILPDDPYLPEIYNDQSDKQGYTGDMFMFKTSVRDNVAVKEVWIEFWFGMDEHSNLSLDLVEFYEGIISIPLESTDELHYIVWALDTYSNIASSSLTTVPIIDDDYPEMGLDLSAETAFTGDEFSFRINVTDNIAIKTVTLEYWLEGRDSVNVSMIKMDDFIFDYLIPIDFNGSIFYFFSVCDNALNWNSSEVYMREVFDNDRPKILEDKSAQIGTTGDEYRFIMEPLDNIGVDEVSVEYWFGDGAKLNLTMNNEDADFVLTITIPQNTIGPMYYIYYMRDATNNYNRSQMKNISIIDNDPPKAISQGDIVIDQNENVLFDGLDSTDNLQIINFSWSFVYASKTVTLYKETPTFFFEKVGHYLIKLTVLDATGNSNWTYFNVTVRDITAPKALQESPSTVFMGETFTLDGSSSFDNVGIINYTWTVIINGNSMEYYGVLPSIVINDPGNYSFILKVVDNAGNTDQIKFYVIVKESETDDDDTGDDDTGDDDTGDDDTGDDDTGDDDIGEDNDDIPPNRKEEDKDESDKFDLGSTTVIITGAIVGVLVLIIIVLLLVIIRRKKVAKPIEVKEDKSDPDIQSSLPPIDEAKKTEVESKVNVKINEAYVDKMIEKDDPTTEKNDKSEINELTSIASLPSVKKETKIISNQTDDGKKIDKDSIEKSLLTPIIFEKGPKPQPRKKVVMKKRTDMKKDDEPSKDLVKEDKGVSNDKSDLDEWDI